MSHAAQCLLCRHARRQGRLPSGCLRFEASKLDADTSSVLAAMLYQNAGTKRCPGFEKLEYGPDAYWAEDLPR